MYVSMKSMLTHANENNYAVMAVNCVNMELVKAIIGAAEEENAPVIIDISPRQFKAHADLNLMVPMIQSYAENVNVPVALNLDHGKEYNDVMDTIRIGFSSVMFDGSTLDYEENVSRTRMITNVAHDLGISVEAELGHVGIALDGDSDRQDLYTDVNQALDFIYRTDVDCLAVAIGTAHGNYPKGIVPKIDFDRLQELKNALKIPLVLHGGSGAGEENIKKLVSLGINKINVCTDLFNIGRDAIASELKQNPTIDYMDLQHVAEIAMKKYIKNYMRLIGSSNRYIYQ